MRGFTVCVVDGMRNRFAGFRMRHSGAVMRDCGFAFGLTGH
jgi:hypothetical protein